MADQAAPATVKGSITNEGEGPRSFFDSDGQLQVIRPGETHEGEYLEADSGDLPGGLRFASASESKGGKAPAPDANPAPLFAPLDGLDKAGLLAQAAREGFATIAAQPELDEADIRAAIELGRETLGAEAKAEADALEAANTIPQLRELAKAEKVKLEGDDNKADIAFKIAYDRKTRPAS